MVPLNLLVLASFTFIITSVFSQAFAQQPAAGELSMHDCVTVCTCMSSVYSYATHSLLSHRCLYYLQHVYYYVATALLGIEFHKFSFFIVAIRCLRCDSQVDAILKNGSNISVQFNTKQLCICCGNTTAEIISLGRLFSSSDALVYDSGMKYIRETKSYELCFIPRSSVQLTIQGLNSTSENDGDSLVFNIVPEQHNDGTACMFAWSCPYSSTHHSLL